MNENQIIEYLSEALKNAIPTEEFLKESLRIVDKRRLKMSEEKQLTKVEVVQEGKKIIVPEGMTPAQVTEWVDRWANDQETNIAVNEATEYYPLDGAQAMWKVLKKQFGWADTVTVRTLFGDVPPNMIALEINPGEYIQVPWGRIAVPGLDGFLQTGFTYNEKTGITFTLHGQVKKKDLHKVENIVREMRESFDELTVYRKKAIRLKFPEEGEGFDIQEHTPKFISLKGISENELILPKEVEGLVQACIFTPIEHSERVRAMGIPMKRGILLEGPYGVGKTLTAYLTSKKAVENGWTFIYLESARDVPQAIKFARKYSPAVIFAEDIDREFDADERDEDTDEILNTIDGIDSKDSEVMVILTTNDVKSIHKAMLRPGRLDSVIRFKAPDKDAVKRIIQLYAGDLLASNINLDGVAEKLEGQIPAVIREVIERSKLYAIRNTVGDSIVLTAQDLEDSATGMLNHVELLKENTEVKDTPMQEFGRAVGRQLGEALSNGKHY